MRTSVSHKALAVLAVTALTSTLTATAHAARAASCPALRSGHYLMLDPGGTDKVIPTVVNAVQLSVTNAHGSFTLEPVNGMPCVFNGSDGRSLMVASGGTFLSVAGSQIKVGVRAVRAKRTELEGTWNFMRAVQSSDQLLHTVNGTIDIGHKGQVVVKTCGNGVTDSCTPLGTYRLHHAAPGLFEVQDDNGTVMAHWVVMRNAQRELGLFTVGANGFSLGAAVPATPLTVPQVGSQFQTWDMRITPTGSMSSSVLSYKIKAADEQAQTFTRYEYTNCRTDVLHLNSGRTGMVSRDGGTYQDCLGNPRTLSKLLSLGGMRDKFGFTLYGWESTDPAESRFFGVSINLSN